MKKSRACFADGGQISKADQLIAEMNAKYGIGGGTPAATAQQPAPQPKPQPAPPQQPERAQGIIGILKGRQQQIDKASGYANGGLIEGIGTPTSDSIPARVRETGEDIAVSTKERIVSHEQDKLLQRLAKAMGFESVDAFFEAGTGKPVGPTIKGGKKAAAGGWSLDNNPDEYAKAMQATRNTLSIPSLSTNNSAAQGGIYKDVGLPSISVGAGQAPTIYENGGLPTKTDRVSGSLPVATAQNSVSPSNDGPRPWYAGASSADNRTGLEMERGRRAEATSAGVTNDPVKSALQYGVVGQNGTAQAPAQVPSHASNPLSAGALSSPPFSLEKERFPLPAGAGNFITGKDGAMPDSSGGGFTQSGKSYTVNPTSQEGISKVTARGTSPLYTNINPEQAVSGMKNQMIGGDAASVNEGLSRYANANKITGEMIANRDKDIPAGGYAPGILGDGGVEAANAEKTQRWRQDDLLRLATRGNQAAIGALLNADGHRDVAAMSNETARQNAGIAAQREINRDQVTMRGQDLNAQNELLRLQGNPLDNQTKQLALTQAQRIAELQGKAIAGDKNALSSLQALTGKNPNADRYITVQGGEEIGPDGMSKIRRPSYVFDQNTGQRVQEGGRQSIAFGDFEKAYLAKRPGTKPEQIKADYEQLYGGR